MWHIYCEDEFGTEYYVTEEETYIAACKTAYWLEQGSMDEETGSYARHFVVEAK